MASIAGILEKAGYTVFLPQRDGLEFAQLLPVLIEKGIPSHQASRILNLAIFDLDVFQVMNSHGLILNMNGRVPDEGAMVEAGIAWSHEKQLVIFKNDDRSLIQGNCNPLVMGLSNFEFITKYEDIPHAFNNKFSKNGNGKTNVKSSFNTSLGKGAEISEYLTSKKSIQEISELLIHLFGEALCQTSRDQKKSCTRVKSQP